jgi:predicted amidophosphoribosyltransferase
MLPDSSMQTLRLQRETDFLKCIYCFASRPQDPNAKYCAECGKNLPSMPTVKLVQPHSGKVSFKHLLYKPFQKTLPDVRSEVY